VVTGTDFDWGSARTFPKGLLDEVIDAAGVREVRRRLLPARLVLLVTLAAWLFMRCGYGLVLSKLADAQASSGRGRGDWRPATSGALCKARERLGGDVVRLLFERVKGVKGSELTLGCSDGACGW
jgi:hypothetical protein